MALSLKWTGLAAVSILALALAACGGSLQSPREANHPGSGTTTTPTFSSSPAAGEASRSPSVARARPLVTPPGAALQVTPVAPVAPLRVAPAAPVQQPAGCGAARSGPPAPQCPPP